MNGCMRQLSSSDNELELESLTKLIPTIGLEYERESNTVDTIPQTFETIAVSYRRK